MNILGKRQEQSEWGRMILQTTAKKKAPPKRVRMKGDSQDGRKFGLGEDDPELVNLSVESLRNLGYLLVGRWGSGLESDGGRRNYYMVGALDDPDARKNARVSMPKFLKVKVKYLDDDEGIFYFFQEGIDGVWSELHHQGPLPLNVNL